MNYTEVKEQLSSKIESLNKKMANKNLAEDDYQAIKNSIENYQYIIELADMNHFERGQQQQ